MNPQLSLGPPWDAPGFEMLHSDVRAIVAVLLEEHAPLSQDDSDSVWTFLTLDSLTLNSASLSFFRKFEGACERIREGTLAYYDPEKLRATEFAEYFKGGVGDGAITDAMATAAQRFLVFLREHPDRWPWRPDDPARG